MKEEIRRIMQLVKDGKLSPEDATELIEAFEDSGGAGDVGGGETTGSGRAKARPAPDVEKGKKPSGKAEGEAQREADGTGPEEDTDEGLGEDKRTEPFKGLLIAIEKLGKNMAESVNWKDVASQDRKSVV